MYSAKHETCTRLISPRTLYISDIKSVRRRARGTREPFAHLHYRKNLESKRVSLSVKTAATERITNARFAAINKFHLE